MKSNKIKLQLKKENSEANKNADKQTDGRTDGWLSFTSRSESYRCTKEEAVQLNNSFAIVLTTS